MICYTVGPLSENQEIKFIIDNESQHIAHVLYLEYFVYREEELIFEVQDIGIDSHHIVSNFVILASSYQFYNHSL